MTQDQNNNEFYQPVDTSIGPQQLINDPAIAAELATIEATQGQDVARAREQALKRQFETDLSDQERDNIAIHDAIVNKYPHAFRTVIGPTTGEKFYVLKRDRNDPVSATTILTQHGHLYAHMEHNDRRFPDLTRLTPADLERAMSGVEALPDDSIPKRLFQGVLPSAPGSEATVSVIVSIRQISSSFTGVGLENLKKLLQATEERELAGAKPANPIRPNIQAVIDQL